MKNKLNQSKLKLAMVSAIVAGSMGLSASSYAATAAGNMSVGNGCQSRLLHDGRCDEFSPTMIRPQQKIFLALPR